MLSPRSTKCMSALVWLLHVQETLYCDIYLLFASDLVVLINLTFAVFPLFRFSEGEEKKKYIRLFASTLPHPLLLFPLLSCVCFVSQCAPVHRKIPWLLKVRLLYRSTKSKCMFPFCLTRSTPPLTTEQHTRTQTCTQRCIKGRSAHGFLLSGWKVTVCLSRPRKDEGWEVELYLFLKVNIITTVWKNQ